MTDAENVVIEHNSSIPALVRTYGAGAVTAEHKALIIALLESGQTLASILRDNPEVPGAGMIHAARRKDEAFDAAFREARANGAAQRIEEVLDYSYSVRGNKQLAIAASKYADVVLKSAPLLAPKEFGALLKLAGADGEKLTVALVDYAQAKPIDAQFKDVRAIADKA